MNQEKLKELLLPETEKINKVMRQDLKFIENSLLAELITYAIFNGGKRVRPLLAVLWSKLCRLDDNGNDNVYLFSLVFEYLHAASLLHDDVIDNAEKRRGRTVANLVWDNSKVILAGDFLHTRAMLLAGTIGGEDCLRIICQATSAMVESEFLQMQNAQRQNTSEDNYFRVLQGKTTSLITAACESGVIMSHGSKEQQQAARTYGANLGHTFQIVDDLLDYLGSPEKTGKALGNDFQEGKMTLPLIHTLKSAPPEDREFINSLLAASSQVRMENFKKALDIIEMTGGFAYARKKAETLIMEAVSSLDIFHDSPEKSILTALAGYVLHRDK